MPTIYDIDNIKLIQAHKYPTSPTSNALQAKKLELSNKIAQIVSNPKLQLFKSAVTLQS